MKIRKEKSIIYYSYKGFIVKEIWPGGKIFYPLGLKQYKKAEREEKIKRILNV